MCEGGYECAICLEGEGESTAPLKLACSHSFCAACLRSHALAQLKQQGRYLAPCPLCKREMRMKEVACVFASADPKSRSEFVALLRKVQGGGLWQEEETATENLEENDEERDCLHEGRERDREGERQIVCGVRYALALCSIRYFLAKHGLVSDMSIF